MSGGRQYTTDEFLDRSGQSHSLSSSFPGQYVISISSRIPVASAPPRVADPPPCHETQWDSDFDDEPTPQQPPPLPSPQKRQKLKQAQPSSKPGLVMVRRPRNLDLRFISLHHSHSLTLCRSRALSLRIKLHSLRDVRSSSHDAGGTMETMTEMVTAILPYYRFFFSLPALPHRPWPHDLKIALESIICQRSDDSSSVTAMRARHSHREQSSEPTRHSSAAGSGEGALLEEIGAFSD
jgi:hypothetical protein